MKQTRETARLAEAAAALAATISEIINERLSEVAAARENNIQPAPAAERWVSKKDVAAHFNVSLRTMANWMNKGYLPYVRIGRRVSFKLSEVDEAVSRRLGTRNRAW